MRVGLIALTISAAISKKMIKPDSKFHYLTKEFQHVYTFEQKMFHNIAVILSVIFGLAYIVLHN